MCENICPTDGLLSIALASSPPSGRALSRLTRMSLLRSQESSNTSSRRLEDVSIGASLSAILSAVGSSGVLGIRGALWSPEVIEHTEQIAIQICRCELVQAPRIRLRYGHQFD